MTPEEVKALIDRMQAVEEGPQPRLPGEKAVAPQGTALVGTEGPPNTFGANPAEIQAIRSAIEYIAGGPKEERIRQLTEHEGELSALEVPFAAGKTLESPEGQYQVGNEDVEGARLGFQAAGAAAVGSMPFPRPAGSLGVFLGRPQADWLAQRGRPGAQLALDAAERMEARGVRPALIRQRAHEIFRKNNEPTFGTVYKPNYPGAKWTFEVATNKSKIDRPDPGRPPERLAEQYMNQDLYTAIPGIEETMIEGMHVGRAYHEPGEPGVAAGEPDKPSTIGLRGPKVGLRTMSDVQYDLARELQNEINWRNDWPRGGREEEFYPGGELAGRVKPGERTQDAYKRLAGTNLAIAAGERHNLTPAQLRRIPVQTSLRQAGVDPTAEPIVERYNRQRIRTHAEPEMQKRLAENLAKGARQTVADMKAAGAAPEAIAARLQKDYGSPVTAEEVRSDRGWWNVPETGAGGYSRWTPEQRELFLKLHQQGAPYQEIAKQLRGLGRETNPRAIKDKARAERLEPRQRGGSARNRPPAVPAKKKDLET